MIAYGRAYVDASYFIGTRPAEVATMRARARARAYHSRNSTFIIGRDGHVSDVATAAHAVPNRRESPTGARQSAKSG